MPETGPRKLRNILIFPRLYDVLQNLVAADRCRAVFLDEYVKPRAGQRILDIGCGTAHVLRFLPAGVRYVGVDCNPLYIAQARAHYGSRGDFLVGSSDLPELSERGPFDVVLAMFLMHHLDDAQLLSLCRDAQRMLAPGGRFVTIDPCVVPQAHAVERCLMARDRGAHIRTEEGYRRVVASVFPSPKGSVRRDLLRIPYTHFILEARNVLPSV